MSMQITSGSAEILAQGMVTSFGGAPLSFLVEDPLRVEVTMRFITDPEVEGVAVHSELVDGVRHFELINFDSTQGRGSAQPVLLGEAGEHLVFMHFRVFRFGRTIDHTVHFTFYLAAKEALGWTQTSPK